MRSFSERSPLLIGAVGLVTVVVMVLAALQWQKLPFLNSGKEYSAYFAEAGGLSTVPVSKSPASWWATSRAIELNETGVLVTFKVGDDVRLGDRTEAAIKTKSLLGAKIIDVTPRGDGQLYGAIPLDRTVSPYQLPDALGDLATTISGLNTDQLSDSLATLAQTFSATPPDLQAAVAGVARFRKRSTPRRPTAQAAGQRRQSDGSAGQTHRPHREPGERHRCAAGAAANTKRGVGPDLGKHLGGRAAAHGFIAENRQQLRPALDKLNGVLTIIDDRKERVQQAIKLSTPTSCRLANRCPPAVLQSLCGQPLSGQFVQPFVDAAFSDLGLDPATLLPSELTDPQTGQPGDPGVAGALPADRPGWGTQAVPARRHHRQTRRSGCGPPGVAWPGCYPYRQPLPAPPPVARRRARPQRRPGPAPRPSPTRRRYTCRPRARPPAQQPESDHDGR